MQELSEKHSSQKKYKLSKINRFVMPKAAFELNKWKRRKRLLKRETTLVRVENSLLEEQMRRLQL